MAMTSAVRFVFTGEIKCASFVGFARHRANRLNLRLDVGACDGTSATMTVGGQEALVDMFEMACSLGPYDCIVYDVVRTDTDFPAPAGGISGEIE
jgi:acylphosphatase